MDSNQPQGPAPEVLKPRATDTPPPEDNQAQTGQPTTPDDKKRRRSYRPSHKATFIGLAVVGAILLVNIAVLAFILKGKSDNSPNRDQVTISPAVLDKLGVSTASVGAAGTKLTVGPDAEFLGTVKITGDTGIGGTLTLSKKVSGTEASFTGLQAGKTSLSQLDINNGATFHNGFAATGKVQLQGDTTITQLTINKSLIVGGNLSLGGTLTTAALNANNLIAASILTIGGHVITSGARPSVSRGSCIGSNGTVSISGNDAAGTVAVNTGVGGCNGIVASVTFNKQYSNTPHVSLTPVSSVVNNYYVTRTSVGFSIGFSGVGAGGYAFDYIVEQ